MDYLALIISAFAFFFSIIRYRSAYPSVKLIHYYKDRFKYFIRFTCGNTSDQFSLIGYKSLKKISPFSYDKFDYMINLKKYDFLVRSKLDIPLEWNLEKGKYKFIFLTDRKHPKKLKLKFEMPIPKLLSQLEKPSVI